MIKIEMDHSGKIAAWVCRGLNMSVDEISPVLSLGFYDGSRLIGGLIYHNYRSGCDIWWTIYTIDRRWCNRRVLSLIFNLAFRALNCRRINLLVSRGNEVCLKFVKKLGFKVEGLLRAYRPDGEDCYILGMLKSEWRENK